MDSVGIFDPVKKIYRKRHSQYHIRGVADILGCARGRFIAIEVKSRVGRQSPEQKAYGERLNASGGYYMVARSHEEVKAWLDSIFINLT